MDPSKQVLSECPVPARHDVLTAVHLPREGHFPARMHCPENGPAVSANQGAYPLTLGSLIGFCPCVWAWLILSRA